MQYGSAKKALHDRTSIRILNAKAGVSVQEPDSSGDSVVKLSRNELRSYNTMKPNISVYARAAGNMLPGSQFPAPLEPEAF